MTLEEEFEKWKLDRLCDPNHFIGWRAYAKDLERKYLDMAKQMQPRFKAGTVFDKYAFAIDEDGVAWWIDPEAQMITRAYPGDPLERHGEGENTPSEFSDYQRQ